MSCVTYRSVGNEIGDTGATAIADTLKENNSLTELGLKSAQRNGLLALTALA